MNSRNKNFKEGFMEGLRAAGAVLFEGAKNVSRKVIEGIPEAGIRGASYSSEFALTPSEAARLNKFHSGRGNFRNGVLSPSPSAGTGEAAGGGGGGAVASIPPMGVLKFNGLPPTTGAVKFGTPGAHGTLKLHEYNFSSIYPRRSILLPREVNVESTAATAGAVNSAAIARAAKVTSEFMKRQTYPGYTGQFTKDGRPNLRTKSGRDYMEARSGSVENGRLQGGSKRRTRGRK